MRLAGVVVALLVLTAASAAGQFDPCRTILCYEQMLRETTNPAQRAHIYTQLAWLHNGAGDLEAALASFREVLTIGRQTGDRKLEGTAINWIGLMQQFLNDYAAAADSYRRGLEISREIRDRELEGIALFHFGWMQFLRKDYEGAVRYFNESLAARRDARDRSGEGLTLIKLGMAYTSLGQFEKALQYESEALPLVRAFSDPRAEADVLDHMGVALTWLKRYEEAIDRHTSALEIRRRFGDRWTFQFSLSNRARALRAAGRTVEAVRDMREVTEIIESARKKFSAKRFRASMFAGTTGHYEFYINLLMDAGDEMGALSASEHARARLTLDAVREALARADSAEGVSVLAREDTVRDELERQQRSLDTALPEQAHALAARVESLSQELRAVEAEIALRYPTLAGARRADALNADQIRAELLDDHTALLEYFLGREKSYAWVFTRDALHSVELPARPTIEAAAARLHALLAKGDQRAIRHDVEVAQRDLSSMIVAPLKLPDGAQRLIIVPDGSLFYVPFAAFLIDQYEIVMAPSASALVLLRRGQLARAAAEAAVAVFADPVFGRDDPRVAGRGPAKPAPDPDLVRSAEESGLTELRRLPATRAEANTIASLVRGPARKALDFEASRQTVLAENLGRYRVVHFATHALVNAQHPDLSGIVLSLVDERGAPVDGFLRVHDLYRLNGASDLVVLSACRTATGKELRGEGIVGLVSGFMNAGTPRIVASYWDVKDQPTAELMKRFYRGLFTAGATPAAALRAAQRSMRAEERWRSPYYWASFALYGLP